MYVFVVPERFGCCEHITDLSPVVALEDFALSLLRELSTHHVDAHYSFGHS